MKLVRYDIREAGRHWSITPLLDAQRLVPVLVVVGVGPGAVVPPDEARPAVAGGVRGVVPVVGLRPLPAQARRFLTVGLADDGVVAFADAALLDGYRREDIARRVRRGARLALHAVARVGEVVVCRELRSNAGYVVEAHPVAFGIRVGLVRHHVVQAADLLEANLRRVAVDIHDLPGVLEGLRGVFADGDPHAVRDVLQIEVASARIGTADLPDRARQGVRDVRVRMREQLERRLRDGDRPLGREPHEAGHLPLDRRAERDAELERAEGCPLQRVAVAVRAVLVAAAAAVREDVLAVVSAAVAGVDVLRRAGPDLDSVDVHAADVPVDGGGHGAAASLADTARDGELAIARVPSPAPVAVPFPAQALRVERVVVLLVVPVALPVVAEPVGVAAVPGAAPADGRVEDDEASAAAPGGAARRARGRGPADGQRRIGEVVDPGTRSPDRSARLVPREGAAAALHRKILERPHVALVGSRGRAVRTPRGVDHEVDGRVRPLREHGVRPAAVARDLRASFEAELGGVGEEMERRRRTEDRGGAVRAEAQGQGRGHVVRRERDTQTVVERRGRGRAGGAGVRLPFEAHARKRPGRGVGRRSREEVLLPGARPADSERPLPDEVRGGAGGPVGGEAVEEPPGDERVGGDDVRRRHLVCRVYAAEDLGVERESCVVAVRRRVECVGTAEPVVLVCVGDSVAVEVGKRGLNGGIGVGAVDNPVAVGIARKRIRPAPKLLAVGETVRVRVREIRIRVVAEQLVDRRHAVAVPVGVREVVERQPRPLERGRIPVKLRKRACELAVRDAHDEIRDDLVRERGEVVSEHDAAGFLELHLETDGPVGQAVQEDVPPGHHEGVRGREALPVEALGPVHERVPVRPGGDTDVRF